MKKLGTLIIAAFISLSTFAQGVNDQAVIPLSVTLNSIMRLSVTSGGNIEFVFNSIGQYSTGITSLTGRYRTTFTVSSSQNYNVSLIPETGTFLSDAGVGLDLDVMEYTLTGGDATSTLLATHAGGTYDDLAAAAALIVDSNTGNGGASHTYNIDWQCGIAPNTIQSKNPVPGRYSTNIFLTLTRDL